MPRLFVAVWPPDDVLDQLAVLPRPEAGGIRWTERGQWHVTLRFLGQVAEVAPVVEALAGLDLPETEAVLGPAVGRFGQRILHVPVSGLEEVTADVVDATAHLGEPPDDRPFSGHVTLARVARNAKADLRGLTKTPVEAQWEVKSVCLVESQMSPTGARYQVLEEFRTAPRSRSGRWT